MLLREAVQRRTVELEHQNRELEIEAAMERVRVKTMAMQRSEELAEVAWYRFLNKLKTSALIHLAVDLTFGMTNIKTLSPG